MILQLPRLLAKDVAKVAVAVAAARAAIAIGAHAAEAAEARAELVVDEVKKLLEGPAWRWGEPGYEASRQGGTGWYRKVTILQKEGG